MKKGMRLKKMPKDSDRKGNKKLSFGSKGKCQIKTMKSK